MMEYLTKTPPTPINRKSLDEALVNMTPRYNLNTQTYTTWYGLRVGIELCDPSDFKPGELVNFSLTRRKMRFSKDYSILELAQEFYYQTQRLEFLLPNAIECAGLCVLTTMLAHKINPDAHLAVKVANGALWSVLVSYALPFADTIAAGITSKKFRKSTQE